MKAGTGKMEMGTKRRRMKLVLYYTPMECLRAMCLRHGLKRGDIVKLVYHHIAPDGTEGFSIEVFDAIGETVAVTAVPPTALEPLGMT